MDASCRESVKISLQFCSENDIEKGDDCMDQLMEDSGCKFDQEDGRLFTDYPLYCEGYHKPMCRGVLHLLCAVMLPTVLLFFIQECRGSPLGIAVCVCYVTSNTFCYGVSGMYHIFEWNPREEILLQKLDHCGIAILSVGTILPDALLVLGSGLSEINNNIGYAMAGISTILCCYTCRQIWMRRPSVGLQALVAVWWVLPFLVPNYLYMTTTEFLAMLMTCLFQGLGVMVFVYRAPDPMPDFFGYHEVFHTLVVFAGISVLVCNYSIVHRYGLAYEQKSI